MSSASQDAGAPALGTVLAGGYQLARFLGKGGMGAVYEAVAPDGRRVAVKVLLGSGVQSADSVERFKREALITGSLESPHIVKLVDAKIDPTLRIPFMVMPLLVGFDLSELLGRVGPLHPAVVARIFRQVARAFDVAHRAGAVHRDIKPANLYLDHDREGRVTARVLDFGIAKWRPEAGQDLTGTTAVFGTPPYMSPEHLQSTKNVDHRSDLWSIGVALYEALTGRRPFDGDSVVSLFFAISDLPVVPVQDLAPWVDAGLAAVVHGLLIRNRELRCQSAHDLGEALGRYTQGGDELGAGMLVALEPAMRAYRAARMAAPPQSWSEVTLSAASASAIALADAGADRLIGKSIGGRYTVLRLLGRGGMGAVYEAEGPDRGRYALKVIDLEATGKSAAVLQRFAREAKVTTAIRSDHVVRVLEAGTDTAIGVPFMVMELLRGCDLSAVPVPLKPIVAARLFVQAAGGLAAAHAQGLVHRDIKPANLYLHEQPNGEVTVKLCDFGVVKRLLADAEGEATAILTHTGGVIGSPMYMSPEQAQSSRSVDARSDVWSLGATLYEALTGEKPWPGFEGVGQLIVAICTANPPHVQDRAPWVPAGLADVVHKAMRRNPSERFASVEDFAAALEPFTRGTVSIIKGEVETVSREERDTVVPRTTSASQATHIPNGASPVLPAATLGGASLTGPRSVPEAPPRRSALVVALMAVAAAATGAVGVIVATRAGSSGSGTSSSSDSVEHPVPQASTARGSQHAVEVEISPPTAQVSIGGKVQALVDGRIVLEGEVGESFTLSGSDGGGPVVERTVVITKDGHAEPARLDFAASGMSTGGALAADSVAPSASSSPPMASQRPGPSPSTTRPNTPLIPSSAAKAATPPAGADSWH